MQEYTYFLVQNIDCGFSLESPHNLCTHNLYFEQKYEKISKKILLKIFNFYNVRKICILQVHGCVFIVVYIDINLRSKLHLAFLAHLSRRLTGELIVYPCSGVRPSFTFSNIFSSETAWPIKAKLHVEHP